MFVCFGSQAFLSWMFLCLNVLASSSKLSERLASENKWLPCLGTEQWLVFSRQPEVMVTMLAELATSMS